MALWWLANAVLLLGVIPLVLLLANRVLRPAREIRRYADDISEHTSGIQGALDALSELATTRQHAGDLAAQAAGYAMALSDPVGPQGRRAEG